MIFVRPMAWWERRWFAAMMAALAAVPLLWPALPPLGDLPGHMARWHIAMTLPESADLRRYYDYHWGLVGNLGLDLIVPALARVLPFEQASKVAVIAIPVLTVAGLLAVAREVHGRVPPTALLAIPFAYAWPFQFGFVNFALAQALALCALAAWIRWGRDGRMRSRVFAMVACGLWVAHSFGWGLFGLMAAGAEVARLRGGGRRWWPALWRAGMACMPLAAPVVLMALGGVGPSGHRIADDWFDWSAKALWVASMLRDRWMAFDILSLAVPAVALYWAARRGWFAPMLGFPALLCLAAFVVLPRLLMGGAYVDMRIAPAAVMLALIAIRPVEGDARAIALMALAFVGVRIAGTTVSFAGRSIEQQRELAAVAAIARGSAVLSLVARPCGGAWSDPRRDELPSMAIVRRDAFTNSQWALEGQQLLRVRYTQAAPYLGDPTQQVLPAECAILGSNFAQAIARFPRGAFTHVWTIGFAPGAAKARDLRVVWTNGGSTLYAVSR